MARFPNKKHKQHGKGAVFSDKGSPQIIRIVGEGDGELSENFWDSVGKPRFREHPHRNQKEISVKHFVLKKTLWGSEFADSGQRGRDTSRETRDFLQFSSNNCRF